MRIKIFAFTLLTSVSSIYTINAQQLVLKTNLGHSDAINCIAFSPNGKFIASGSNDNTVKLWNAQTGHEIRSFEGHSTWVVSLAISPSSKTLASGCSDGTLKLWNAETGTEILKFIGHQGWIEGVNFHPDGEMLVSCSSDKTIKLWDVKTGLEIKSFIGHTDWVNSVAFSPDGKFIVSGGNDKILRLWDILNGKQIRKFEGHTQAIKSIAYSSDGNTIISGSEDETLIVWNAQTGEKVRRIDGYKSKVQSVSFSPDGKTILSAYSNGIIKLWDAQTGREMLHIESNSSSMKSIAFSPDGNFIVSGSSSRGIKLWDAQTGIEVRNIKSQTYGVKNASFSPLGKRIISESTFLNTQNLWSFQSGEKERFTTLTDANCFAFSPDEKYLIKSYNDNTLKIWDFQSGKVIQSFSVEAGMVKRVFFSNNSKLIAIVSSKMLSRGLWRENCRIWDTNTKKVVLSIEGETRNTVNIAFSPDCKYIVTTHYDNISLWDIQTGNEIRKFIGHSKKITSIAFSPDSKTVVSGSADMSIKLWDIETGQEVRTYSKHLNTVNAVNFSPDGKQIISCSDDNSLILWDVQSGKEIRKFSGHSNSINSAVFSPNGKYIISGGMDATIKIWETNTGKLLITLIALNDNKNWIVYTPDGRFDGTTGGMKFLNFVKGLEVIPLENLYEHFYTPRLLTRIMEGEKIEAPLLNVANLSLPPLVKIISQNNSMRGFVTLKSVLQSDQQTIEISTEVFDQGGGIDEIVLFQNGKLVHTTSRGFIPSASNQSKISKTFSISLVNGENRIKASAFNKQRTEAIPYEIIVNYSAPVQIKPNLYILAIGINEYSNPRYNLNYAKSDAEAIVKALQTGGSGIFDKISVSFLSDAKATREAILEEVETIKSKINQEDVFVFYYAGHGVMSAGNINEKSDFFLVLHNITKMYEADDMLKSKGISAKEIGAFSKSIRSQKQLFLLDACQSGGAMQTLAMRGAAEEKAIAQLSRSTGTYFIAASGTEQFATEVATLGHGIFTYSIIEALKGQCKSQDGRLTVNLLKGCVEDMVPELSKKYKGSPQFPTGYGFGQDFPIVIIK